MILTAEQIVMGLTVQRPVCVTTGHSVTDVMAAVPACTAGLDTPVKKVDLHASPTAAAEETCSMTTHYSTII